MATSSEINADSANLVQKILESGASEPRHAQSYAWLNNAAKAGELSPHTAAGAGRFPFPKPSVGHICARCKGIPLEIFQVGSDFFSKKCKGEHGGGENCKGKHEIRCDHCKAQITDAHYHCGFCNDENFDICATCKESGKHCLDSKHLLRKRTFHEKLIREVSDTDDENFNPGITRDIVAVGLQPYRLHDSLSDLLASAEAGCHCCSLLVGRLGDAVEKTPKDTPVFIENRPVLVPPNIRFVSFMARQMALEPDLDADADEELPATMLAVRTERDPDNPVYYDDTRDRIVRWLPFELRGTHRMLHSRVVDWNDQSLCRQISPAVDAGDNLKVIGHWLGSCLGGESRCSTFPKESFKPTRLICVDSDESGNPSLRLVRGSDIGETAIGYVTLSYCWGTTGQQSRWILTNERLKAFEDGISYENLPKTIADAVKLVHALGIRYLWVDSLCIVQDDADDWSKEAYRMSQVYTGSLFTAISGSDSALGGLFLPREQLKVSAAEFSVSSSTGQETVVATLYPALGRIGTLHRDGPTSKRAWCYQEELLSARRLYFTDSQFVWECLCSSHDETGRRYPGDTRSTGHTPPRYDADILLRGSQVLGEWYSVVAEYTSRLLSFHGDIFAALAGIAANIKPRYEARYIAGIWDNDALHGLLWQRVGESLDRPTEFDAPSWSWLSVKGHVIFARGSQTFQENDAEYLDCDVRTKDGDEFSTLLPGGTLRLRARMLPCQVAPEIEGQEVEKLANAYQELPRQIRRLKSQKNGNTSSNESEDGDNDEREEGAEDGEEGACGSENDDEEGREIENKEILGGDIEDAGERDKEEGRDVDKIDDSEEEEDSEGDSKEGGEGNFFLRSGAWEVENRYSISPPGGRLDMIARVKLRSATTDRAFASVFFDGEDEAKTTEFLVAYLAATQRPENTIDRNGIALVPVDGEKDKYRRIGFVAFWDKLIKDDLGFLESVEKTEVVLV